MSQALLLPDAAANDASKAARPASRPNRGRVLHLINGENYAGAERVQDLLAVGLARLGWQSAFACVKPGRFAALRMAQDAPVFDLGMRSRFDFRPVWQLAQLLRRERFDVLHTHTVRTALLGRPAALLAGVPMVHHMHTQTASEIVRPWRNRMYAAAERVSLLGVAGIAAVSPTIADYLRRSGVPQRLITIIPNGVPSLGPLEDRPAPSPAGAVVGMAALFRERKGLETMLAALAQLRGQGATVRLRAIGRFETPEYEARIKAETERLSLTNAVDWVGFTQNVTAELRRCDLMVLPSLAAEGMPMCVLEAFAAGLPVVGSRVAGVIDVVQDNVTGLLAEPGDDADLARAIGGLLTQPERWRALREAAHRRHAERYSDSSMAAGVAALYERFVSLRAGGGRGASSAEAMAHTLPLI